MEENIKKLEWEENFSVGVQEIDEQHKKIIETVNKLVSAVDSKLSDEDLAGIIKELIEYKEKHFKTEEKYFKLCKYAEAEEHIKEHKKFGEKLKAIQNQFGGDALELAFKLADFMEDWLINHLMTVDQKYKDSFKLAGLK